MSRIHRLLALLILLPSVAWPCSGTDAYSTAVCADSPVHYLRMDAASGTTETDLGSTNFTAAGGAMTYVGGFTLNQTGALIGSTDKAVSFNGSTGYVHAVHGGTFTFGACGPDYTNGNGWSWEGWVNPTGSFATAPYIVYSSGNPPGAANSVWQIAVNTTGGFQGFFFQVGNGVTDSAVNIQVGTPTGGNWYYLTVTTVGSGSNHLSSIKVYVNASLLSSTSYSATALLTCNNQTDIALATIPDASTRFFPGVIDEPAWYSSVLAQNQVTNHYNAATVAGLPTMGRRIFQSRRTTVSPYFLPVSVGVREPQPFAVDLPIFEIDRINRQMPSRSIYR